MPAAQPNSQTIEDVEKCVSFLKDLELLWSGASRSRAIIEQLLVEYRNRTSTNPQGRHHTQDQLVGSNKRSFAEFETSNTADTGEEFFFWQQIAGPEFFAFEATDPDLFSSWDGT